MPAGSGPSSPSRHGAPTPFDALLVATGLAQAGWQAGAPPPPEPKPRAKPATRAERALRPAAAGVFKVATPTRRGAAARRGGSPPAGRLPLPPLRRVRVPASQQPSASHNSVTSPSSHAMDFRCVLLQGCLSGAGNAAFHSRRRRSLRGVCFGTHGRAPDQAAALRPPPPPSRSGIDSGAASHLSPRTPPAALPPLAGASPGRTILDAGLAVILSSMPAEDAAQLAAARSFLSTVGCAASAAAAPPALPWRRQQAVLAAPCGQQAGLSAARRFLAGF